MHRQFSPFIRNNDISCTKTHSRTYDYPSVLKGAYPVLLQKYWSSTILQNTSLGAMYSDYVRQLKICHNFTWAFQAIWGLEKFDTQMLCYMKLNESSSVNYSRRLFFRYGATQPIKIPVFIPVLFVSAFTNNSFVKHSRIFWCKIKHVTIILYTEAWEKYGFKHLSNKQFIYPLKKTYTSPSSLRGPESLGAT